MDRWHPSSPVSESWIRGTSLLAQPRLEFDFIAKAITTWDGTPVGTIRSKRGPGRIQWSQTYVDLRGAAVLRTHHSGWTVWGPHRCIDVAGQLVGVARWRDCRVNGVVVARSHQRKAARVSCSVAGVELASVSPGPWSRWSRHRRWRLEVQPWVDAATRLMLMTMPEICDGVEGVGDDEQPGCARLWSHRA